MMLRNVRRSRRLSNGASPKPSSSSSSSSASSSVSSKKRSVEDENELDQLHADIFGNDYLM
jgi:hypothetical protein